MVAHMAQNLLASARSQLLNRRQLLFVVHVEDVSSELLLRVRVPRPPLIPLAKKNFVLLFAGSPFAAMKVFADANLNRCNTGRRHHVLLRCLQLPIAQRVPARTKRVVVA